MKFEKRYIMDESGGNRDSYRDDTEIEKHIIIFILPRHVFLYLFLFSSFTINLIQIQFFSILFSINIMIDEEIL